MEDQKILGIDFSIASKELIETFLEETAEPEILEEILRENAHRPEIIKLLLENPDVPENIREEAARLLSPVKIQAAPLVKKEKAGKTAEMRSQTLLQRVQNLTVSERRLLAMRGGREARSILLKDTNKQIILAVLDNPKITETEIEILSHSRSVPDEVLRAITKNKDWMKNYGVLLGVVSNPKTPAGVAIPLLSNLKTRDIATLEKNKNVAEAIRSASKKLMQARRH
ncbi:MAG: hypothetical protein HY754_08805 [Nitrospirae bacterium]|nr:hypothetical protein [Nitrospirota bacterium]